MFSFARHSKSKISNWWWTVDKVSFSLAVFLIFIGAMLVLSASPSAAHRDRLADDFNSSIGFDSRMYRQDIKGSMAHAAMLSATGSAIQTPFTPKNTGSSSTGNIVEIKTGITDSG